MSFTDIKTTDPYYYAVKDLYDGWIITDNWDHLFRPNDLMSRDFFVSLAVEIGCHECQTPSTDDIIRYQISPFIDLDKSNTYYYCIAYAADNNITQWYILNENNKAYCENKKEYASSPFCAENTISRIEASAILLRRAKLWDDTLNQTNFDKTLAIPDVKSYWYGYAKKGIEIWILKQKNDNTIGQDEKISRWEFAIMAAKILQYTQCSNTNTDNIIESSIVIKDANGSNINKSDFWMWEKFTLNAITGSGNWNYTWTLKNPNTGEIIIFSGATIDWSKLNEGTWIVDVDIIDPQNGNTVSQSQSTINIWNSNTYSGDIGIKTSNGTLSNSNTFNIKDTITLVSTHTWWPWDQSWEAIDEKTGKIVTGIGKELPGSKLGEWNWSITLITRDPKTGTIVDTDKRNIIINNNWSSNTNNNLSVNLVATPIVANLWESINLNTHTNGTGNLIYKWDFGDGTILTTNSGNTTHPFTAPWIYPITVTVTDPKTWETAQSIVVVRVTGNIDTDGDGIFDIDDSCPYIYAKTTNGCPIVNTYNPNTGNNWSNSNNGNTNINNTVAAQIGIRWNNGNIINSSNFNKWDSFILVPITSTWTWNYTWTATNPVTWQVINGTWNNLSGSLFDTGDWTVKLNVIDPKDNSIVASPSITLHIWDTNTTTSSGNYIPCVTVFANPISANINTPIDFDSYTCPNNNNLIYNWNYWDGMTFPNSKNTSHTYTLPGIYTVTLKVTDPITGKTGESQVIISITWAATYTNESTGINNICIADRKKKQWLLIGTPNCTQCPCSNSIEINSLLRSCDVVFPTVLSPTLNSIYTRGWFYLVQ